MDVLSRKRSTKVLGLGLHKRSVLLAVSLVTAGALVVVATGTSTAQTRSSNKVTLTIWENWTTLVTGLTPLRTELDQAFEKAYPNIKVNDIEVAYATQGTKLRAAIAAGKGPNLVTLYPGVFAATYRSGLVDLRPYLTAADKATWGLLNTATVPGGQILSVPWTQYGYFYYYNKSLFRQAGLNPNDPPTTWNGFVQDCEALNRHGIVALAGGFKDGYLWENYAFPLLDQLLNRSQTAKMLNYQLSYTSPAFQTVWADIKALGTDGCFTRSNILNETMYEDQYTSFEAGKAAIEQDAAVPANIDAAQKQLGVSNMGVFAVPRLNDSVWPAFDDVGPNNGWAMTKWTTDKAAAWDYISFMESAKTENLMWKYGSFIPNNTQSSVTTSNPVLKYIFKVMKNPLDHTIYTAFPLSVLAINERYATEMMLGQVSIGTVLKDMETLRESLAPEITGS